MAAHDRLYRIARAPCWPALLAGAAGPAPGWPPAAPPVVTMLGELHHRRLRPGRRRRPAGAAAGGPGAAGRRRRCVRARRGLGRHHRRRPGAARLQRPGRHRPLPGGPGRQRPAAGPRSAAHTANLTAIVRRLKARRIRRLLAGMPAPPQIGAVLRPGVRRRLPGRGPRRAARFSIPICWPGWTRSAPAAARRHPSQRRRRADHRRAPGAGGGAGAGGEGQDGRAP